MTPLLVLVFAVLAACCPAQARDQRVDVAERSVARFHELYNSDVGSVVPELMRLDDTHSPEWTEWMKAAWQRDGRMQRARLIGWDVLSAGNATSVELRYATTFSRVEAREVFIVQMDHDAERITFYARWWAGQG